MRVRRNTKRYSVWTVVLTIAAIGGMLFAKWGISDTVPVVTIETLRRTTVEETAICTGSVQASESTGVYVSTPCVAGKIAVKEGDRVRAGDVLLEVDRQATLAMAVSAGLSGDTAVLASAALPETVVAPHDGIVRAVSATQGEPLQTTAPCVMLSESGGVEIAVAIRERHLPKIAVGQSVVVTGVAFDKAQYTGTVTEISSSARNRLIGTSTETVVDAVVTLNKDEVDESLLVGLNAKAAVTVDRMEQVLLLPYDCLIRSEDGSTAVYCVRGDTAVRTDVTLGKEFSGGVQVIDGVEDGDAVVRSPNALWGETVRVKAEVTA